MNKLVEMRVNEYLDVLKSDAPAPGGGSVSALAGAQGVGLFMMVADLTIGREKYFDCQEVCLAAKETGEQLFAALCEAVDRDTEAFNLVSAAFRMPRDTDEAKAARNMAIAEATLTATEVPFEVMKLAREGLLTAENLAGHSNPNAASDLGVAVLNLMACIKGAWLNVKINLPGVKDIVRAKEIEAEGERIHEECETLARVLYQTILKSL